MGIWVYEWGVPHAVAYRAFQISPGDPVAGLHRIIEECPGPIAWIARELILDARHRERIFSLVTAGLKPWPEAEAVVREKCPGW